MSRSPVHFELFIRRKVNAPWSLEMASEDRTRILGLADEMLLDGRAAAVRVTKEVLDEDSREFASVTLLSKGAVHARREGKSAEADNGPLCVTPQDLYTYHARERIGRLLEGWLRRKAVTPFELLHRPDLAEQLDAAGVEIQHAVQKIAIPEAQARGRTTHDMVRTFQALTDRTLERLVRDGRRNAFPRFDKAGFAAVVERLCDEPDCQYLIGGGVAQFISGAKRWGEKVDLLLDLADAAPIAGRPRAMALQVLEQPLGEIVAVKDSLADLLGKDLDLGGSLAAMGRLASGVEVEKLIIFDPGLARLLPALSPEAARMASWLQKDAFENVRAAVVRRMMGELAGPRRLRPSDADGEIGILRALAMVLTAASPRLLPTEDVHEVFLERSKRLVGSDFVSIYLADRPNGIAEVEALAQLAENVVGAINKSAAARWITGTIGALRFEKEIRGNGASAPAKLAALANLQRSVRRANLPEANEQACVQRIGEIGSAVEVEAKLIALIGRADSPLPTRLTHLLRLAAGQSGPTGPVADRARSEIMRLLKSPELYAALADSPETMAGIRDLMAGAGLAA